MSLMAHPARIAAVAAGETKFDTGVPCRHGHLSPRYVRHDGRCVECERIRQETINSTPRGKARKRRFSVKRGNARIAARLAREAIRSAEIKARNAAAWANRAIPSHSQPQKRTHRRAPHHVVKGIGRI
jgi:hypothetical protein